MSTVLIDTRFPCAVAGEDYDRYMRAVWREGERWFIRYSHRIGRESIAIDEARDILRAIAMRDVERDLNASEERLLGDLLQKGWSAVHRLPDDAEPEIPAFLVSSPA